MSAEAHSREANRSGRQPLSPVKRARLEKLFEHSGKETLAPRDFEYVTELLTQCVLGDPSNSGYVRAYIENLQKKYHNNKKGCSLAQFKELGARSGLKKALAHQQWDEAIKHGLKVLTVNPWDITALTGMATAAKQSGDRRSELCYLKAAVMGAPKDPACNRLFAIAMTERRLIDQAIALWHRVEEALPNDDEAKRAIAELTIQKANSRGDFDVPDEDDRVGKKLRFKAQQQEEMTHKERIQQRIEAEPSNLVHYLELAQIFLGEERYDEAEEILGQAYEISESDPNIRDRWEDAQLRHLRQKIAMTEDGEDKQRLQQEYAQKDLEVCHGRVERFPDNRRFRFDLGYRLVLAGRYPEAMQELQVAQKDPARAGVSQLMLGQCFQQLKQYALAMSHYESAIQEIPSGDADHKKRALYLGGRLAIALKDIDTAEKHLSALASLDFCYGDSAVLLGRIAKMRTLHENVRFVGKQTSVET